MSRCAAPDSENRTGSYAHWLWLLVRPPMKTYRNSKTIQARAEGGQFRQWTGDDFGIGECPECRHITTLPEMPDSLNGGFIDPAEMARYRSARECRNCGWSNAADEGRAKRVPSGRLLDSEPQTIE